MKKSIIFKVLIGLGILIAGSAAALAALCFLSEEDEEETDSWYDYE